jgi:predicted enzyme related to lactoylglutathione lyase
MKIKKNFPLMTATDLGAQKAFYCEHFGFRPTFEGESYLGLISKENTCEISFMLPAEGKGDGVSTNLALCMEVDDVDSEHKRLKGEGVKFIQAPKDNPWGDRGAIALDPAGISVYIYKTIPPTAEYAKQFKE